MIDLSQFIQKYTLQREQLDTAQHIVSRTEFRAHAWTDGKKVEYREGDIEIAYPKEKEMDWLMPWICLLYTSPSPRDQRGSRMPSSA